jgi:hypothetical protein
MEQGPGIDFKWIFVLPFHESPNHYLVPLLSKTGQGCQLVIDTEGFRD